MYAGRIGKRRAWLAADPRHGNFNRLKRCRDVSLRRPSVHLSDGGVSQRGEPRAIGYRVFQEDGESSDVAARKNKFLPNGRD